MKVIVGVQQEVNSPHHLLDSSYHLPVFVVEVPHRLYVAVHAVKHWDVPGSVPQTWCGWVVHLAVAVVDATAHQAPLSACHFFVWESAGRV